MSLSYCRSQPPIGEPWWTEFVLEAADPLVGITVGELDMALSRIFAASPAKLRLSRERVERLTRVRGEDRAPLFLDDRVETEVSLDEGLPVYYVQTTRSYFDDKGAHEGLPVHCQVHEARTAIGQVWPM